MSDEFTHKLVVVARRDLKMSAGKLAAQVAHAAVDCALMAKADDARAFKKWSQAGAAKVVLRVDSQRALFEVREAAQAAGLTTKLVTDAGRTELEPGTVTCLGVGPASVAQIDAVTGSLPLW